jgi:hypothetical protein
MTQASYVVLREVESGHWLLVGEVRRRPGMPARASRLQAIKDATGADPADGAAYAVLPRSEWVVAQALLLE